MFKKMSSTQKVLLGAVVGYGAYMLWQKYRVPAPMLVAAPPSSPIPGSAVTMPDGSQMIAGMGYENENNNCSMN